MGLYRVLSGVPLEHRGDAEEKEDRYANKQLVCEHIYCGVRRACFKRLEIYHGFKCQGLNKRVDDFSIDANGDLGLLPCHTALQTCMENDTVS